MRTSKALLRGLKVVEEALLLEDFPMTTDEVNYAVGDIEIESGKGKFIPVRDAMDEIEKDRFENPDEIVEALRQVTGRARHKAAA